MDLSIAAILGQDGITNGAIYALLSLALVLVFLVTRAIFIPQGEFVAFGALTLATLQSGRAPGAIWLLILWLPKPAPPLAGSLAPPKSSREAACFIERGVLLYYERNRQTAKLPLPMTVGDEDSALAMWRSNSGAKVL